MSAFAAGGSVLTTPCNLPTPTLCAESALSPSVQVLEDFALILEREMGANLDKDNGKKVPTRKSQFLHVLYSVFAPSMITSFALTYKNIIINKYITKIIVTIVTVILIIRLEEKRLRWSWR